VELSRIRINTASAFAYGAGLVSISAAAYAYLARQYFLIDLCAQLGVFAIFFVLAYFSKQYRTTMDRVLDYTGFWYVWLFIVILGLPLSCVLIEFVYMREGNHLLLDWPVILMVICISANCAELVRMKWNGSYVEDDMPPLTRG